MNKEIEIPEGYEARIKDNKVIIELKSEDERIRKEIIGYLNNRVATAEETELLYFKRWLAYLERQKEQKWSPSEGEMGVLYKLCYISNQITDEDDTELTRLYQDLKREFFNGHSFENMFPSEKQKEQKPAEWSKEDERNLYNTIEAIKYTFDVSEGSSGSRLIAWLKFHLRPQSHWRPSKKQMEALEDAFRKDGGNEYRKVINSLYCDLQKLL